MTQPHMQLLACSAMFLLDLPSRCQLCATKGQYLDGGSRCVDCPDAGRRIALVVGLVVGCAALMAGCFVALVHPAGERIPLLRPARRAIAWLACYARSIGIVPKLKILFSFCGIATSLDDVYDAQMPPAYTEWVSAAFGWAQIDWVSWQLPHNFPFACMFATPSDFVS